MAEPKKYDHVKLQERIWLDLEEAAYYLFEDSTKVPELKELIENGYLILSVRGTRWIDRSSIDDYMKSGFKARPMQASSFIKEQEAQLAREMEGEKKAALRKTVKAGEEAEKKLKREDGGLFKPTDEPEREKITPEEYQKRLESEQAEMEAKPAEV